jgi:hypothetical protein
MITALNRIRTRPTSLAFDSAENLRRTAFDVADDGHPRADARACSRFSHRLRPRRWLFNDRECCCCAVLPRTSVPSVSSCRTVVRSRVTFFIGRCRSTRTLCLKDRHGELKIQRTCRRSTPKARGKKTCRARPWPRICSALKHRHPLSGPSPRLSRSFMRSRVGAALI